MNIGIAGVGKMGAAIAARLMEAGNQMTVWNRSPEKAKPLRPAGSAIAFRVQRALARDEVLLRPDRACRGSA